MIGLRTFLPGIDSPDILALEYATVGAKVKAEVFNDSIEVFSREFYGVKAGSAKNRDYP